VVSALADAPRQLGGRRRAWIFAGIAALSGHLAALGLLGFERFEHTFTLQTRQRPLVLEIIPAPRARLGAPATPEAVKAQPTLAQRVQRPRDAAATLVHSNPAPPPPASPLPRAPREDDADAAVRRLLNQVQACSRITPEERQGHPCVGVAPGPGTDPWIDPIAPSTRLALNAEEIRKEDILEAHRELTQMMISATPPNGSTGARGSSSSVHYGCIMRGGKTTCSTY